MSYPAALDTSVSLPNPTGTNTQNNPDHAALHTAENVAIIALEGKVGTGANTPTASTLLFGTGTGTSAWTQLTSAQLLATLTDETGTGSAVFATTPTLVTPKVDTINESTPANGVTIDGLNIKDNKLNTNDSVVTANITDSAVTSAKVAAGAAVQFAYNQVATAATGTTVLPTDGTIPQITEGDQYMTQAITPKSATNILSIEANALITFTVASKDVTIALFQDATANALAVNMVLMPATTTTPVTLTLRYAMVAGTTSSTTFRIRIGPESAGTVSFNAAVGVSPIFGSVIPKSGIWITEYKA